MPGGNICLALSSEGMTLKYRDLQSQEHLIFNQLGKTWNHLAIWVLLEYYMSWASFVKILGERNVFILGFWIRSSLGICWSRLWNMRLLLISPGKVPVFSMVLPCFAKPWIYMKPSTDEPPNRELRLYVLAELLVVHLLPETHGMMSWCQRDGHFPVHWEILRKCCVCCEGVATTTTTLWRLKTFGTALRFTQGSMPIPWWNFNSFRMSGTHRDVNHMTIHPVWQNCSYLAWSQKNTHSKHFRKAMNVMIDWVWPLPSNSDRQDYRILVGNPYKPLFVTVTGRGPYRTQMIDKQNYENTNFHHFELFSGCCVTVVLTDNFRGSQSNLWWIVICRYISYHVPWTTKIGTQYTYVHIIMVNQKLAQLPFKSTIDI